MILDAWKSLGRGARVGLAAGAVLIVAATIAAAAWLLRTDYQVLFADLKPQDTAAMAAELDRMKVPYRLGGDGNTLLVEASAVHATRMKLMGKDIPLHGAAGFELFNSADFGMTEFAQKINYQRALQGEITRTILSLAEVRDARVHLALPEEGLFKRAESKPKAAITLTLKPGQSLRPEQVSGIQRLVSAAVPGIAVQDVTLVDQQGVALTRPAGELDPDAGAGNRLEMKRETERLLAHKATQVLEAAFGPGQALATVDVTLNMDQVRVTTEDVLGAPGPQGPGATGVIVRERESARDPGPPLGRTEDAARAASSQREVEYQVGRRVEQVASQPGTVRRIHAVALVRQSLDPAQAEQVRGLVAAAVGAVPERGDSVVVQSTSALRMSGGPVAEGAKPLDDVPAAVVGERSSLPNVQPASAVAEEVVAAIAGALVLSLLALLAWIRLRGRGGRPMTPAQREQALARMRQWLEQEPRP